ncbi:hypothetical protein ACPV3S_12935 [Photobacterium damselae]|uniref:hypothetical protein n=1 Tax=Photobacterium damselae TaxID=38293 RepID=UPI004068A678
MLIRLLFLLPLLLSHTSAWAGLWPFDNGDEQALSKTCPNCIVVAKDIQELQKKTCSDGLKPSTVMEIAQSKQFYPMLLALKNSASEETYQAALEKIKTNMQCSDWTVEEKIQSAFDYLSQGMDSLQQTFKEIAP